MSKVILITGASSGIGKATALTLIKAGHTVYGAARRLAPLQELVAAGGHLLQLDVTDEAQVKAGVAQIIREQGRLEVLINNAGYALYGAVEDVALDDARQQFEVNLFGVARLTQEVLPHMRAQKAGKIINISSMGGKIYTPLGAWYHATKHALEGWSDCLRLELRQFNIAVVVVEPGLIATELGTVLYEPLLKNSGSGPYRELAQAVAQSTQDTYEQAGAASPPSVVAQVVAKAVRAPNPATRYVVGKMAKPLLFLRKYLGDRVFDKAVMSQVS